MAQLPGHDIARIDIGNMTLYVLNPAHRDGGGKARVIARALGLDARSAMDFAAAIRLGLDTAEAIAGLTDRFGTRYTVDMTIEGASGTAVVRTGWIVEAGSARPRLVTAFVR